MSAQRRRVPHVPPRFWPKRTTDKVRSGWRLDNLVAESSAEVEAMRRELFREHARGHGLRLVAMPTDGEAP